MNQGGRRGCHSEPALLLSQRVLHRPTPPNHFQQWISLATRVIFSAHCTHLPLCLHRHLSIDHCCGIDSQSSGLLGADWHILPHIGRAFHLWSIDIGNGPCFDSRCLSIETSRPHISSTLSLGNRFSMTPSVWSSSMHSPNSCKWRTNMTKW